MLIIDNCFGLGQQLEGESHDKPFDLQLIQSSLIRVVSKVSPIIIVVLNAGGNMKMESWLPKVKGVTHAFYPGQE